MRFGPMIYIISGPSGSGKSTLIRLVLAVLEGVNFSISHTTRERRNAEVEGRDYFFVSEDEFKRMVRRNQFIEWAVVHGDYYGTSRKELKKGARQDLLLDIDVQGANQIKKKMLEAVFIIVLPPSFDVLKRRLVERGLESVTAVRKRLAAAKQEIQEYSRFDHVIVNDNLDEAVQNLACIILCRRTSLKAVAKEIRPILASFRKE
jgi:guanylate kinase